MTRATFIPGAYDVRLLRPTELRDAQKQYEREVRERQKEIIKIRRELERREPRIVHFRIEMDRGNFPGVCFEIVDSPTRRRPNGMRHRVHPRRPEKQTQYPQDLCADEIDTWMKREGFTHVIAETDDTETSPECIKRGRHSRAAFITWWRMLEED